MNRCAVVIGVNKTGNLPVLGGAVSGAEQFADWAKGQDIEVSLLTDKNGKKVTLGEIKKVIKAFSETNSFSQMIVFFSGHGILTAPNCELWLLSGAPDDPDEAVNVVGSIALARNIGIPHVVVISDACRSRPNETKLSQVTGGLIFPNESPKTPRPALDVFYATLPGNPASEVSSKEAVDNYRGIFTECMLKGLKGKVPKVIVPVSESGKPSNKSKQTWVVPSREMKEYLEDEVPDSASQVDIKLQQNPDIRVESSLPAFLAEVAPPPGPSSKPPRPPIQPDSFDIRPGSLKGKKGFGGMGAGLNIREPINRIARPEKARNISQSQDFNDSVERLSQVRGRESFETQTGFTVVGEKVAKVAVKFEGYDLFNEFEADQIRVKQNPDLSFPRSLLLKFRNGSVIPLAILPGFIGTVVVEEGQVVNVMYFPSRNNPRYIEYEGYRTEVERRRAYAAVASRNGLFQLKDDATAIEAANYLRNMKSFDPTFGLYAAYSYAQAGAIEEIESVFEYMSQEREPIIFDVGMLARKIMDHIPSINQRFAPFCPVLTQGWALLDAYRVNLLIEVQGAGRHLKPGLWTTFEEDSVNELWDKVVKGDIE